MTATDFFIALAGLYLSAALLISAWRSARQRAGDIPVWVAFFGTWALIAYGRWIAPSELNAAISMAAWALATALLVVIGGVLGRSSRPRVLTWLLGPMQALAIAATWLVKVRAQRMRSAAMPETSRDLPNEADEAMENVVELRETTLAEVMVPRSEIEALPEDARVREWLALVRESKRSRVPVYREDLDEIVGQLQSSDLFATPDLEGPIAPFVRQVRFVPESMRCDDLLRELIAQGDRLAIAVDEFGGTAGLVTDQDLFEILLGEIEQERPMLGPWKIGPRTYAADGALRVDDLNESLAVGLPEGDYETVAGLILARLGRIPAGGERIEVDGVTLEVVASSGRRIQRVSITVPAAGGHEQSGASRARTGGSVGDRRG